MITVKGFLSIPKLTDNTQNSTAIFGELSQYASTFARDYKTYVLDTDSSVNFCLFSSTDGINKIDLNKTNTDLCCQIGIWAYNTGTTITNTNTKQDFSNLLQNYLGSAISSVSCGDLITDSIRRLPKWISWQTTDATNTYQFKVWLSCADFELSYTDYEIAVVPPVDSIDKLFMSYADLLGELALNDLSVIHDRMNVVRGKYPETIVRSIMIELIDKTNNSNTTQVGWTVLIYGPAGDTLDNIKDAIQSYISQNSTNTENDWRLIMPDLYNTTCFYVIPRWDSFAIQNRLSIAGIYSPVVTNSDNLTYVSNLTSSYLSATHLQTNLQFTIHRYKSISLAIIGGEQNKLNLFKFTDYFADYIAEESTSEDFNRQAQATKNITTLFTTILNKIDNYDSDSTLPSNIRLLEKYNQRFLVGVQDNIEYYVMMKPNQQPT